MKKRALISVFLALMSCTAARGTEPPERGPVVWIDVHATINPGVDAYIRYGVEEALRRKAQALVVQLNTPGGLISSTREIVSAISESKVPVVVYVSPAGASATSAGAFILEAAAVAAMDSGTNVGASTPVDGDGKDIQGAMGKKVMNDTRALMRSLAERNGRNVAEAERFVTEALSLTGQEAKDKGLVDLLIGGSGEGRLLQALDGRKAMAGDKEFTLATAGLEPVRLDPKPSHSLLIYLAHPTIAHALTSLGSLGIFVEILSPGLMVPGVVGVISLILGLVCLQTLPIHVGFMVLMFVGIALCFAEFFVSGFGILGIGGGVAFVLGSLNLFEDPTPAYQQSVISIAVACGLVVGAMVLVFYLGARKRKLAGRTGEAMVAFDDAGPVLIGSERFEAKTTKALQAGQKVEVIRELPGGKVKVRPAK